MKTGKTKQLLKISLLLIGVIIICSYGTNATHAANTTAISNDTSNNTTNQTINTNNNTLPDPYIQGKGNYVTIQDAVNAASSGDTIILDPGTYTGTGNYNININGDMNLNLIGSNDPNNPTIIDAQGQGSIFDININPGYTVNIKNIIMKNAVNSTDTGGAIYFANGVLTVTNCTFINNKALAGGAIYGFDAGIGDPRVGITVVNCTFTNNQATAGNGGAICNAGLFGSVSVKDSTFTGNNAYGLGKGGAIYSYTQYLWANFCRFINNNGAQIYGANGGNVDNNWWGTNTPTFSQSTPNSWLVLDITANPTSILLGDSSTITTTILSYNPTSGVYSSVGDCVSIPITFTATDGNMNPTSSTLIANQGNDQATSTFTATSGGLATITATVDYLHLNTQIQVKIPTIITVPNVSGYYGNTATLTTTLKNNQGNGMPNEVVYFTINGNTVSATTDNTGTANYHNYPLNLPPGTYTITANFQGDTNYQSSTGTGTLIIQKNPTTISVPNVTGIYDNTVTLTATLKNNQGQPLSGETITFTVNGNPAGSATTNNQGLATINNYPLSLAPGQYTINATFNGDTNYQYISGIGTLTINKNPTTTTTTNVTSYAGHIVTLNATVIDNNGNPVDEGNISFTVNGVNAGTVPVNKGIATLNYSIPSGWTAGNYIILANYQGTNNYTVSSNTSILTLNPSAYLYLNITGLNNNPVVGEPFTITYKLGNKGPDAAQNVTITIPLPEGFEIANISGDGKWTYDANNNTITWTLSNVPVGDPYLYISGHVNKPGTYVFGSSISSETYNINTEGVTPVTINAVSEVKAASKTIPMQETGLPISGLILAILAVFGGLVMPQRK